jgi:hypothetical protein
VSNGRLRREMHSWKTYLSMVRLATSSPEAGCANGAHPAMLRTFLLSRCSGLHLRLVNRPKPEDEDGCQRGCQRRWRASRRLLGANTAQVSHGTRTCHCLESGWATGLARPAPRDGPTGCPKTSGAGLAWTCPFPTLILLGLVDQPGFVGPARRAFRAAETALGRATPKG